MAGLPAVIAAGEPLAYAALRIGYGVTLVTHGIPKLLGLPHGSMADPMAGSVRLIDTALGLPFAAQIGAAVAILEGIGGALLAAGLATRPLAFAFALQMVGICVALGPTYPWIDRGIEYPVILGLIGIALATRGGGRFSLDRRLFRAA
ncbi:DoxX family protein [Sphingosinicella sp. BN140058]|uniref:DoxX family protein n=1 Tax=Sphingosinicella sp. BN140058 TaxID=1892855 RepID=UPI001011D769|nr:DoxX family protein [Sphingosinicella sp. BN140058]QAY76490.1 DoxX family protein [Sphingosinicella sp. BN140058]